MNTKGKSQHRVMRHRRVRAKVSGTASRPRIAIFRSNKFIYAQVIDDSASKTILNASDYAGKKGKAIKGTKSEKATNVAEKLAEALKQKGINEAVFDRGGFKYHGRIKAFADGLRNGGIKI